MRSSSLKRKAKDITPNYRVADLRRTIKKVKLSPPVNRFKVSGRKIKVNLRNNKTSPVVNAVVNL
jgi:hypothetical protein